MGIIHKIVFLSVLAKMETMPQKGRQWLFLKKIFIYCFGL